MRVRSHRADPFLFSAGVSPVVSGQLFQFGRQRQSGACRKFRLDGGLVAHPEFEVSQGQLNVGRREIR